MNFDNDRNKEYLLMTNSNRGIFLRMKISFEITQNVVWYRIGFNSQFVYSYRKKSTFLPKLICFLRVFIFDFIKLALLIVGKSHSDVPIIKD